MKNKTLENQKNSEKEAVGRGILPWWALMILARHSGVLVPLKHYRHLHHCDVCGCVMVCQFKDCKGPGMLCPECSHR